ncbi:MAG: FAD-dependent oxidoreductase [Siculibacillus sp.]|nr:FAD-dependent oxidoreductase [Siculibacillus sp.]
MIDRRSVLLAGLAGLPVARLAFAAVPRDVEVVIVGAGAAGIAAARRLVAGGRSCVVIEASGRIGGRCVTDSAIFGRPCDLGAHRLIAAAATPFPAMARDLGVRLHEPEEEETLRVGRRRAEDAEIDAFSQGIEGFGQAIHEAGRRGVDVAASEMLPRGLGRVGDLVAFAVGALDCGKDLDRASSLDLARARRGSHHVVAGGHGALLARLAEGLPIVTGVAAVRIDRSGRRIRVETSAGTIEAAAAIVTVATDVLARGGIRFDPPLPGDQEDALVGLSLGVRERVILEIPGNPLRLRDDEEVFFVRPGKRTLRLTGNVEGGDLVFADVGGSFADELVRAGERAMVDFALSSLVEAFGGEAKKKVARGRATAWRRDPLFGGASSCAEPGHGDDRTILRRPLDGRLWLAGEASHPTLWGTVGGAFLEGERAADEVLTALPG